MSRHSNKFRPAPSDPAEAARRRMEAMTADAKRRELEARAQADPANWGLRQDIADLPSNDDIQPSKDVAGKITRAERWDVFRLMRSAGTLTGLHTIAIDKFQRDIAIRHRTAGASGSGIVVDASNHKHPLDASIEAAQRLGGLMAYMDAEEAQRFPRRPPYSARLLLDICGPPAIKGQRIDWRRETKRVTGLIDKDAQGRAVRMACDLLLSAHDAGADQIERARAA